MKQIFQTVKSFLFHRRKIIFLIITVVAFTLLVSGLFSQLLSRYYGINLPSVGNIRTIGVKAYADSQLKNELANIAWGSIDPGSVINMTCYIRSTSNEQINLNMTTGKWQYTNATGIVPNEKGYIGLSWDSEGKSLEPGQNTTVLLTLHVSISYDFISFLVENQVQSFSFEIMIQPRAPS